MAGALAAGLVGQDIFSAACASLLRNVERMRPTRDNSTAGALSCDRKTGRVARPLCNRVKVAREIRVSRVVAERTIADVLLDRESRSPRSSSKENESSLLLVCRENLSYAVELTEVLVRGNESDRVVVPSGGQGSAVSERLKKASESSVSRRWKDKLREDNKPQWWSDAGSSKLCLVEQIVNRLRCAAGQQSNLKSLWAPFAGKVSLPVATLVLRRLPQTTAPWEFCNWVVKHQPQVEWNFSLYHALVQCLTRDRQWVGVRSIVSENGQEGIMPFTIRQVRVSDEVQAPCGIAVGEFIYPREPMKIVPILGAGSVLTEQVGSVLPAKQTYHLASVHWIPITCGASKEDGAPSMGTFHFGSAEDCPIQLTVGVEAEHVKVQSRRRFFGACLFGLAALPVGCHGGEAIAVGATKTKEVTKDAPSPFDESRLLQQNRRMQKLNGAPLGFPGFIREGFSVKVVTDDTYVTTKTGLIYYDLVEGHGEPPQDGQQVIFHYTGYNEAGRRVDSSYQQGQPARTRVGINGMIPGFEEGIKSMRVGGKRRIIIPPDLGPPVGPSTFFSAKQFEVFDVELLDVKSCSRRTVFLYSDVVCE